MRVSAARSGSLSVSSATGGGATGAAAAGGGAAADAGCTAAGVPGREKVCRRAMIARAGATRRPFTTSSRMRASSSRLACMASNSGPSAVTVPLSTSITSVSSSWLRSPMDMIPAMRAPPLRVCSGRFSPRRRSGLFGCARQSLSARSEASISSVASSVKIAATSGSKSTDSAGASACPAAAAAGGALAAFSAAAAAPMRCSRSRSLFSMRSSSCQWLTK